jgi:hypothetical protein
MIRVTFDPNYIDDLQDYYRRNECIREQQYLSPEKLLHLAAFCVLKAAKDGDDEKERNGNVANREVALDVVRQLLVLCENVDQVQAQLEPVIIVKGQTSHERQNDERRAMSMASKSVEKSMASSVIDRSIAWLKFAPETTRN